MKSEENVEDDENEDGKNDENVEEDDDEKNVEDDENEDEVKIISKLIVNKYSPNDKLFITSHEGISGIVLSNKSNVISIIGYDPNSTGHVNIIPKNIMNKLVNVKKSWFYQNLESRALARRRGIDITDITDIM